ncbi:hypothetical protein FISHEDRAFT_59022 [Fistulina hepatica ATCC 64428]|uniref:Uncharacterized protein n=1 Tax=Fistulina hepatica ATCC 64428 TaxID=1128425 RepID=A0A0D7ABY8_9AGAR|nr:hypothetical protein FISHEDRAFT_59022 [Fistulina hepatica ATCC 64428]
MSRGDLMIGGKRIRLGDKGNDGTEHGEAPVEDEARVVAHGDRHQSVHGSGKRWKTSAGRIMTTITQPSGPTTSANLGNVRWGEEPGKWRPCETGKLEENTYTNKATRKAVCAALEPARYDAIARRNAIRAMWRKARTLQFSAQGSLKFLLPALDEQVPRGGGEDHGKTAPQFSKFCSATRSMIVDESDVAAHVT